MPELPDITVYVEHLERRMVGQTILSVRTASPFVVRTYEPPLRSIEGETVTGVQRLGKRIVLELSGDLFVVLHLMIAGRLHWKPAGAKLSGRAALAAFDVAGGTLLFTEATTKQRASLHVVRGQGGMEAFWRGGVEPLTCTAEQFAEALRRENHTLKRCLTDPDLFSGIGNAYSDEILHRARLSPVKQTKTLTIPEMDFLFEATKNVLMEWTARLRAETGDQFPEKVTAFRPEMAVHGRFGKPCPDCASPVQRIVHAENETNYCATCQTGGRLLADRSLSRLLHADWPRSLEELEVRKEQNRARFAR